MAALAAGDLVVTLASLVGRFTLQKDRPLFGTVESLTAGAPPTNVVVDWSDGTRTTYAAVNSGAQSVIGHVTDGGSLLVGFVVQPTAASGVPNPGGRVQGPVVDQFSVDDPNGSTLGEFVVIETPVGFLVLAASGVQIVPSA
jgi:hypothetical protein